MKNPGADTVFLLTVSLLITLVVSSVAQGQSLDLLGIDSPEVQSNSIEWLYQNPQDDDCSFTSPAKQFDEAEVKENVVVNSFGGLTIDSQEDGTYAPEGTFISPVISGPLFNDVQFAYTGHVPPGSSLVFLIKPIYISGRQGAWIVVSPDQDIHFDDKVAQFQYQLILRSDGSSAPTVREITMFAEESKGFLEPLPAPGQSILLSSPSVIEREQWGGRPASAPIGKTGTVDTIVIHHTAGSAANYKGEASMRGIQDFHQKTRGWGDIGYHYVIGPDGKIFRGRPEETLGAHAPPNKGRLGVSVIGNYEHETLSPAAKQALNNLVAHLCGKHGLCGDNIREHGELGNTACPGRDMKNNMGSLKAYVNQATKRGGPTD